MGTIGLRVRACEVDLGFGIQPGSMGPEAHPPHD